MQILAMDPDQVEFCACQVMTYEIDEAEGSCPSIPLGDPPHVDEDGEPAAVTGENVGEWARLHSECEMVGRCTKGLQALQRGFHKMVPTVQRRLTPSVNYAPPNWPDLCFHE